nr:MAG TPA: hypothetical protein [Caudoviricetes sp.]DAN61610.1 MAG TPA: hypothetical protein [Caudoviricetes sp.]DAP04873.1 MAG TPA: hypothetical protein [Caudoviricetes sp.]
MWRILTNRTYYAKHSNRTKIENPSDSHKPEGKSKHFATFTPNENTKT